MNDYYFYLEENILDTKSKSMLLEFATDTIHSTFFKTYVSKKGTPDNNQILVNYELLNNHPVVKHLVNSCTIKTMPILLRHLPGASIRKHTDDHIERRTLIIFPPINDYSPTYFWNKYDDVKPVHTVDFPNMSECIFNTRYIHSLINTSTHNRINFQLCFDKPFEEIKSMVINKTLFKNENIS